MGWIIAGCIILFFLLLMLIPLSLRITWKDGKPQLRARFCHLLLWRVPQKEKPFREKDYTPRALAARDRKAKKRAAGKAKKAEKKARKKEKSFSDGSNKTKKTETGLQQLRRSVPGETLPEQIAFIEDIVGHVLKYTAKKARVTVYALAITVATPDVGQTAILYGAVSGGISCLWECLNRALHLYAPNKERLCVNVDFLAEETKIDCDIRLKTRVGGVILLLLSSLWKILKRRNPNCIQ